MAVLCCDFAFWSVNSKLPKFSVFKIDWNCNFVCLLHHPFWLQLVWHFLVITFQLFKLHRLAKDHWRGFILQSHYPNRRSPDGRWAKIGKIGRRRPIVGRHRHRFWLIFWSADEFFVEAPKLKVSLTDPPIFRGFVIGEASGDGRPMIGRQSADYLKKFSPCYRPKVARSSGVNRPTIARRSVDDILPKNCR